MAAKTQSTSDATSKSRKTAWPKRKSRWRRVLWALVGLLLLAAPAGWLLSGVSRQPQDTGPRLTHIVTRGELIVTVTEPGTLESSDNKEIKCEVRGQNTVIYVVESGTIVEPGDLLVKLDTLLIEEAINERTKYMFWSRSASERSKADEARSELAVSEYEQGRYPAQLKTLQKDLAIANSNLRSAQNMLAHAKLMQERGYVSALEVEERDFQVTQAELNVDVKQTEIEILEKFTKREELERLKGNLAATTARHKADAERAFADKARMDRSLAELKKCEIYADRGGLVIYPSAAAWKRAPDIELGANVHKDQVLLLMPDLTQMQVKLGVHESVIGRMHTGLEAKVKLADRTLHARVSSVADVTTPGGWWTGNVVKYDCTVRLPSEDGLKPGMSAEVEITLAHHKDVLTIPVAAVLDLEDGQYCWVKTEDGPERRTLELGDTNDIHVIVEKGLVEGDEVILNPTAFVKEAESEALQPVDGSMPAETSSADEQ